MKKVIEVKLHTIQEHVLGIKSHVYYTPDEALAFATQIARESGLEVKFHDFTEDGVECIVEPLPILPDPDENPTAYGFVPDAVKEAEQEDKGEFSAEQLARLEEAKGGSVLCESDDVSVKIID